MGSSELLSDMCCHCPLEPQSQALPQLSVISVHTARSRKFDDKGMGMGLVPLARAVFSNQDSMSCIRDLVSSTHSGNVMFILCFF